MTLELAMKRILWITVCLVGAALPGCKPSAVDDPIGDVPPAGTPLPQRSEIPVEVRVGDEWMTVKLSQEALEQFAAQWCLAENVQRADRTLCGTHRFFDDLLVTHIPSEPVVSSPDAFGLCHQGLCVQRVHTCAGYFLEEISRTPTPKRLAPQDVERSHFSVSELALSASDVERLGQVSSRAQMSGGISEVRFQPLKADAKAAALRGALNQYRHSTQWSRLFATMQVEDAGGNFTCAARFAAQDYQYLTAGQGQGTGLQPNERGREPTWSDVLLQSYLDASNQYSRAISLTTDAMRAAAQVQIDGGNAAPDEAATAWNGQVNSAVAVARLLTMAPSQSTVIQPGPGVHTLGLAGCGAQEEGGGRLGPTGVPVCPPISGNDRIQISIDLIRGMQVAPNANAADGIAQILRFYQGLSYQGTDEVLQEQGVSRADISLAVDYLCAEAALEGRAVTVRPHPEIPGVEVASGLHRSVQGLPAAAVSAHFLGDISATGAMNTASVTSYSYSLAGSIRGLDAVQQTGHLLVQTAYGVPDGGSVSLVDPYLYDAAERFQQALKEDVGGRRLEFWIGLGDGLTVDQLKVEVHGVPGEGSTPQEEYWVVQSLQGLTCVLEGKVDDKPCDADDYIHRLNPGASYAANSVHADLGGGTLSKVITRLPKPDQPDSPIRVDEVVYVLRLHSKLPVPSAFGGVVPTPTSLEIEPGWTRRVISPAGGTYEQVLQNALTPRTDDCSQLRDTCAGLPADLWPPLESEVNGQPEAGRGYERSWAQYLDKAKAAAQEADRLGDELLLFGLSMDEKAEAAQAALDEECGADSHAGNDCVSSAGNDTEVAGAALGDQQMCLWSYNGKLCGCPTDGCPPGLGTCPVAYRPNDLVRDESALGANKVKCADYLSLPSGYEAVPVPYTLRLAAVESRAAATCAPLTRLRYYDDPTIDEPPSSDPTVIARRRENYILNEIVPALDQRVVQGIAGSLFYKEEFGDNYVLQYGGSTVFQTRREHRDNQQNLPPCVQSEAGLQTGSVFWSNRLNCFRSGEPSATVPRHQPGYQDFAAGCESDEVGRDGCDSQDRTKMTWDTEPEALTERWAWGFGHLRRSTATLLVMTGQLDKRMSLARPTWTHFDPNLAPPNDHLLYSSPDRGRCSSDHEASEPQWLSHCSQNGNQSRRSQSFCVNLVKRNEGPKLGGAPQQFNAFLPDVAPHVRWFWGPNGEPGPDWAPSATRSWGGGVDPQLIYCEPPISAQQDDREDDYVTQTHSSWFFDAWSPFTGGFMSHPAPFPKPNVAYQDALAKMWEIPPRGEHFCTESYDPPHRYLVWRSLCKRTNGADFVREWDQLKLSRNFMTKGKLPSDEVYADGDQVTKWLGRSSGHHLEFSQMLFDLTQGNYADVFGGAPPPFQYPLSQRNVFDALELACYASSSEGSEISCDNLTTEDALALLETTEKVETIGGIVRCYGHAVNRVVDQLVMAPAPQALVENFSAGKPLPGLSLGGNYLTQLNAQYDSLVEIRAGLRAVANAYLDFSAAVLKIAQIERSRDARLHANSRRQLATMVSAMASAAGALSVEPKQMFAGGAAAIASLIAGNLEVVALKADGEALKGEAESQLLDQRQAILHSMESAKTSADKVVMAANNLNQATQALRLSQKRASRAKGRLTWESYAGEDGQDPQYVNTAMRRIYNTRLRRYELALGRAKRLAFIARRAIELRFGVDLQRQVGDLTLVEAPARWANEICEMQGIDYASIRDPGAVIGTGESESFGFTKDGENFATAYVGEYVAKLEDFVNSYPFDYPLKEGDDLAVISLADDIFGVTPMCHVAGPNLLHFSTAFDRNEADGISPGWATGGCEGEVESEEGDPEPWEGCVIADKVATWPPVVPGDLTPPGGAELYRLKNAGCLTDNCPLEPEASYPAIGYRGQRLQLGVGHHLATLYVREEAGRYSADAAWRITSAAGEVLAEAPLAVGTQWKREELPFYVESPGDYWLEIYPNAPATTPRLLPPGVEQEDGLQESWDGFYLAAAQVEVLPPAVTGTPSAASWAKTDVSRETSIGSCRELRGAELRKRFERRCEFVCADGIRVGCPAQSPDSIPTEVCFYEADFGITLEQVERGDLIRSGQLAIGNFNLRHNTLGVNLVGSGVTDCSTGSPSCYYSGFAEYSLRHDGTTRIRAHDGSSLAVTMQTGVVEHGKALAAERVLTNPPSTTDTSLMEPYLKGEFKGRPIQGSYTIRIWDDPALRWERVEDLQLHWRYHYWTRFRN